MNFPCAFVLLLTGFATAVSAADARKPNIVLIYADDSGYGDLSCYGATRVQTPNIDRWRAKGCGSLTLIRRPATCTPPHPGFYPGEGMKPPPRPNITIGTRALVPQKLR